MLLGARDAGAAQLTASWTDNSGGGAAFTLERRTSDEATFTPLAEVPIGVTSYVDASITPGVTYCYRVKAYSDVGQSPYSDEACGSALDQPRDYSVSITKAGDGGGTVTSTPAGIDCGSGCTVTYAAGTLVTLTATAAAGSRFAGWSGDCSGTGTCRVVGNTPLAVAATFSLLRSASTTTGGSSSTLPSTTLPTSTAAMTGAAPTDVALPSTRRSLTNDADPSSPPSVSSVFVTKAGDGAGTVSSSPTGIECGNGCTMTSTAGTPVMLVATADSGSRFDGWSGQCSGTGACSVNGTGPITVTARFTRLSSSDVADATRRRSAPRPGRPVAQPSALMETETATANAGPTGPRTAAATTGPDPSRPWMAAVQSATADLASPYRLMVRVARRTSIRVRMDNGQTYEEKLKPGAVRVWVSGQPFSITLPNTGGVRFELNGRRLPVPDGIAIADLVLPQPSAARPNRGAGR